MPRMEPNSAGYTLYAVLAEELDETGIPLAYMFARPTAGRAPNSSGPLIQLLALFLSRVLDAGFRPSFFSCDKDSTEIAAISAVFSAARV